MHKYSWAKMEMELLYSTWIFQIKLCSELILPQIPIIIFEETFCSIGQKFVWLHCFPPLCTSLIKTYLAGEGGMMTLWDLLYWNLDPQIHEEL